MVKAATTPPERPHEFELISRYFAPLATDPGCLGLTDDAAVLSPDPGMELVLTKDLLAAGVHFLPDDPADAIASKSLRVNLSDLAAKGAMPRAYMLGLALDDTWNAAWMESFAAGLARDQQSYGITLFGGDTIRAAGGLTISVTAMGQAPIGKAVRRNGAKPGDILFVSGTIGDAALGLRLRLDPALAVPYGLDEAECDHLVSRYLLPQPRVALALAVRNHAAAAMDISDGLGADAAHMSESSGVDIHIDLDEVPLSSAARQACKADASLLATCVTGGDDFEILAAVPADKAESFVRAARAAGVSVSKIGTCVAGEGAVLFEQGGKPVPLGASGFRHF